MRSLIVVYIKDRGGALVDESIFSGDSLLKIKVIFKIFKILWEKKIVNMNIAREEKAFSHWQKGHLFSSVNPPCL